MNVRIPRKVLVKIHKENNSYIAVLPKYNMHTEANSIWGLIVNVNDILKLYFDLPQDTNIMFSPPPQPSSHPHYQPTSLDFIKYMVNNNDSFLNC